MGKLKMPLCPVCRNPLMIASKNNSYYLYCHNSECNYSFRFFLGITDIKVEVDNKAPHKVEL